MKYIKDKELFKCVCFAKKMIYEQHKPFGLSVYKACKYYGYEKEQVLPYLTGKEIDTSIKYIVCRDWMRNDGNWKSEMLRDYYILESKKSKSVLENEQYKISKGYGNENKESWVEYIKSFTDKNKAEKYIKELQTKGDKQ